MHRSEEIRIKKYIEILTRLEKNLGSKKEAYLWLYTANKRLDGKTPYALMAYPETINKVLFIVGSMSEEMRQ